MRSNERDLLLVPKSGHLNKKRRYFNMRNALRVAVNEVIDKKIPMLIYDTNRGLDVAAVHLKYDDVKIEITVPRRFKQLWNRT